MKFTRTLTRFISFAMIGALFFAQMAVAAYVCPAQTGALFMQAQTLGAADIGLHKATGSPMPAMVDMPDCQNMDKTAMDADLPTLCHASCHSAEQRDQPSTVKLPVATLSSLPFVVLPATPMALLGREVSARPMQLVAASAPLAVLYCCFRI